MPLPYYICTGQRPSKEPFVNSPITNLSTVFPIITIVSVTIRFKLHKKNAAQAAAAEVVGDVDKRRFANIVMVIVLMGFVAIQSIITRALDKLEQHELNHPPYSYMCYYRSLVNFPLGIVWIFLVFVFNKDYIQSLLDDVSELKKLH